MIERVIRKWGHYQVLAEGKYVGFSWKVKKLVVYPGMATSFQRHQFRNEFWIFEDGRTQVVRAKEWHILTNNSDQKQIVFELQWGEKCIEEDIERKV